MKSSFVGNYQAQLVSHLATSPFPIAHEKNRNKIHIQGKISFHESFMIASCENENLDEAFDSLLFYSGII